MGEGFVKLFSSILDSSVWCYDSDTRLVWITLLAMSDYEGVVHASIPGIANRARVSLEATEKALEIFQSPDEYSRSTEYDGRRIEKIERDWLILNFQEYRNRMSKEAELARKRKWWRENRGKDSKNDKKLDETSASATLARPITEPDTDTDPEDTNCIVNNTISASDNCKYTLFHNIVRKSDSSNASNANSQPNLFVQNSDSQKFELEYGNKKSLITDPTPVDFTNRQKEFLEAIKKAEFFLRKSAKVKKKGPSGNISGFYALRDPIDFARRIGEDDVYPLVKIFEIQKAANWTKSNKKKAKVYPIDQFLLGWIDRAQERECKNSIPRQNGYHNNNSYQNYHPSHNVFDDLNKPIKVEKRCSTSDLDPEVQKQLHSLMGHDNE